MTTPTSSTPERGDPERLARFLAVEELVVSIRGGKHLTAVMVLDSVLNDEQIDALRSILCTPVAATA